MGKSKKGVEQINATQRIGRNAATDCEYEPWSAQVLVTRNPATTKLRQQGNDAVTLFFEEGVGFGEGHGAFEERGVGAGVL